MPRPDVLVIGAGLGLCYFLGQAPKIGPFLSENIDYAILVIVAFSLLPVAWEWWRHRRTSDAGSGVDAS